MAIWPQSVLVSVVALGVVTGCNASDLTYEPVPPAVPYADLEAACGDYLAPTTYCLAAWDGPVVTVSEHCAEVAGDAMGLDWESFGEAPHSFSAAGTTAELLVAGLLVMSGINGASIGTVVEDSGVPGQLAALLDERRERAAMEEADDAGRVWYSFFAGAIVTTVYEPTLRESGLVMRYSEGTLFVSELATPSLAPPLSVLGTAGSLVHEASHEFLPAHVACDGDDGGCDVDRNGAYGAGAWWRSRWLRANVESLDWWTCQDAMSPLLFDCWSILDDPDYPACLDAQVDWCSGLPEAIDGCEEN